MKRIALFLTMVMLLALLVACGEPETYTVNFVVNGETVSSTEYAKGETPTPPTVDGYETDDKIYTFTGWDKEIVAVTEDATYTAVFSDTVKEFDVTFIYGGATTGTPVKVAYGVTPTAPTEGLNYQTADKVYTFKAWDKTVSAVTGDVTYTATYTSVARKYTVTFVYGPAGAEQKSESFEVAYGTVPTAPTEGLSYVTADKRYTFKAWDKTLAAVSGDVTYTATYDAEDLKFNITFIYDGKTETVQLVPGATVTLPTPAATYTKDGATYAFAGTWDKTPVAVAEDATYTANYTLTEKVLYNENFDGQDLNSITGFVFGAFSSTTGDAKTDLHAGSTTDKYLDLSLTNSTASINANVKDNVGLTAMETLTKLTIKVDLAKKADAKVFNSYIRFRASGASDTIKFLETTDGAKLKFFGTEVAGCSLSETFLSLEMNFDFVSGAATLKIDGAEVATAVMSVPEKSPLVSSMAPAVPTLADWVASTAAKGFVFNWGVMADCSDNAKALLIDNLSIVAY